MTISNPLTASMLASTWINFYDNNETMKRISLSKKPVQKNFKYNETTIKNKFSKYMPNDECIQLPIKTKDVPCKKAILNAELLYGKRYKSNNSKQSLQSFENSHKFHFKFNSTSDEGENNNENDNLGKALYEKSNFIISEINTNEYKDDGSPSLPQTPDLVESVVVFGRNSRFPIKSNNNFNLTDQNKVSNSKLSIRSKIGINENDLLESKSSFLKHQNNISMSKLNNTSVNRKTSFLPALSTVKKTTNPKISEEKNVFSDKSTSVIVKNEFLVKKTTKYVESYNSFIDNLPVISNHKMSSMIRSEFKGVYNIIDEKYHWQNNSELFLTSVNRKTRIK
jgi:hypothetical protein